MAKEVRSGENKVSLDIANELVEFANNKLDAGIDPVVIAAAYRHAAANRNGRAGGNDPSRSAG